MNEAVIRAQAEKAALLEQKNKLVAAVEAYSLALENIPGLDDASKKDLLRALAEKLVNVPNSPLKSIDHNAENVMPPSQVVENRGVDKTKWIGLRQVKADGSPLNATQPDVPTTEGPIVGANEAAPASAQKAPESQEETPEQIKAKYEALRARLISEKKKLFAQLDAIGFTQDKTFEQEIQSLRGKITFGISSNEFGIARVNLERLALAYKIIRTNTPSYVGEEGKKWADKAEELNTIAGDIFTLGQEIHDTYVNYGKVLRFAQGAKFEDELLTKNSINGWNLNK